MKDLEWRPIKELTDDEKHHKETWRIAYLISSGDGPIYYGSEHIPKGADYFCIIPEPVMPFVPVEGKYYMFSDDSKWQQALAQLHATTDGKFIDENGNTWSNCRPMTDAEKELIG